MISLVMEPVQLVNCIEMKMSNMYSGYMAAFKLPLAVHSLCIWPEPEYTPTFQRWDRDVTPNVSSSSVIGVFS